MKLDAATSFPAKVATMSLLQAIALFLLPASVGLAPCNSAYGDDAPFEIITKRDNDQVDVKVLEDTACFSIRSHFGISQAIIKRRDANWPTSVTLRLHLKGLEKFKVTSGKTTLEGSVSTHNGQTRLWKDGRESARLSPKHPYWMQIQRVGENGKPDKPLPLADGYFQMKLPKGLFKDNPKSITIDWIDFYR